MVVSILVVYVSAQGPLIHLDTSLTRAIENAAAKVIEREINRELYERRNNLVISGQYDKFRGVAPFGGIRGPEVGRGFDSTEI